MTTINPPNLSFSKDYFGLKNHPNYLLTGKEANKLFGASEGVPNNVAIYPMVSFNKYGLKFAEMYSSLPIAWKSEGGIETMDALLTKCQERYNLFKDPYSDLPTLQKGIEGKYIDFSFSSYFQLNEAYRAGLSIRYPADYTLCLLICPELKDLDQKYDGLYQAIIFCAKMKNLDHEYCKSVLLGSGYGFSSLTQQYSISFGKSCIVDDITYFLSSLSRQVDRAFFLGEREFQWTSETDLSPELSYMLFVTKIVYRFRVQQLGWRSSISSGPGSLPEITNFSVNVSHFISSQGLDVSAKTYDFIDPVMSGQIKELFYKGKIPWIDFLPTPMKDKIFRFVCEMVDRSSLYAFHIFQRVNAISEANVSAEYFLSRAIAGLSLYDNFNQQVGYFAQGPYTLQQDQMSFVLDFLCPFIEDPYADVNVETFNENPLFNKTVSGNSIFDIRQGHARSLIRSYGAFVQNLQTFSGNAFGGSDTIIDLGKKQNAWCVGNIMFKMIHRAYKVIVQREFLNKVNSEKMLFCRSMMMFMAENLLISNPLKRISITQLYDTMRHKITTFYAELLKDFGSWVGELNILSDKVRKEISNDFTYPFQINDVNWSEYNSLNVLGRAQVFYPRLKCGGNTTSIGNYFTTVQDNEIVVTKDQDMDTNFLVPYRSRKLNQSQCKYYTKRIQQYVPESGFIPKNPNSVTLANIVPTNLLTVNGRRYVDIPFLKTNFYNLQDYTTETLVDPLLQLFVDVVEFSTENKKAIIGVTDLDVYEIREDGVYKAVVDPSQISDTFGVLFQHPVRQPFVYNPYLSPEMNILLSLNTGSGRVSARDIYSEPILQSLNHLSLEIKSELTKHKFTTPQRYVSHKEQTQGDNFFVVQNAWWAGFVIYKIFTYVIDKKLATLECTEQCERIKNFLRDKVLNVKEAQREIPRQELDFYPQEVNNNKMAGSSEPRSKATLPYFNPMTRVSNETSEHGRAWTFSSIFQSGQQRAPVEPGSESSTAYPPRSEFSSGSTKKQSTKSTQSSTQSGKILPPRSIGESSEKSDSKGTKKNNGANLSSSQSSVRQNNERQRNSTYMSYKENTAIPQFSGGPQSGTSPITSSEWSFNLHSEGATPPKHAENYMSGSEEERRIDEFD